MKVHAVVSILLAIEILRPDVVHRPRQLQVFDEALLVVIAQLFFEDQPLVEDVGLERILRGWEFAYKIPEPKQVRASRFFVVGPVFVRAGLKLAHHRVDVVAVVHEGRGLAAEVLELPEEHVAMNPVRSKSAAVLVFEVGIDQVNKVYVIRALQSAQQVPPLVRIEVRSDQKLERAVFEPAEVVSITPESIRGETLPADEILVEDRRLLCRLSTHYFLLMVESQTKPLLDEGERLL